MKLFSFSLLFISFMLVGFGLLKPSEQIEAKVKTTVPATQIDFGKYTQNQYSAKLNNRLCEYMDRSVKQGVPASKDKKGIQAFIRKGKLELIDRGIGFELDTFQYSYAVLTPYAKKVLNEIGKAFHDSLQGTSLSNAKLLVTSMTRTHYTVAKLVRRNRTAVRKSPHLNGNSFDFSFSRFVHESQLSSEEKKYLQELSASILLQFKKDCKIWATFERNEECLHVVARMGK
ncbi:MAG: DUF5715 family protein [Flavobacteriales bacterium]